MYSKIPNPSPTDFSLFHFSKRLPVRIENLTLVSNGDNDGLAARGAVEA